MTLTLGPILVACNASVDAQPTPTRGPDYTDLVSQDAPGSITANGVLVPARRVEEVVAAAGRQRLLFFA